MMVFFFNDTATTEIYTLSLHDALPIWQMIATATATITTIARATTSCTWRNRWASAIARNRKRVACTTRSEEHTSELQSRQYLVCRLLLEKKNTPLFRLPTSSSKTQASD